MATAFDCEDYKEFLRAKISQNQGRLGYKGELAQAAGCHRAYLSQVLNSHVHLTLDHAAGLSRFWGLKSIERDYFLESVNLARAGSPVLQKIICEKMSSLKSTASSVSHRMPKPKIDALEAQQKYYSAWYYSAIHMLVVIEKFRSLSVIAQRLHLPADVVSSALEFLADAGLIRNSGGKWLPVSLDLHLPSSSPWNFSNHQNWRMQALQKMHNAQSDNVHFTGVYALSAKDYKKIRQKILDVIAESRDLAIHSQEEEIFAFSCDLFQV